MPREFRKRGRGGQTKTEPSNTEEINHIPTDEFCAEEAGEIPPVSSSNQPIWESNQIECSLGGEAQPVAEFPVLTPDQRAYWKEIDEKLIEFERLGLDSYHSRTKNPNQQAEEDEEDEDERKLLLRTALTELSGQELALATDPETAVIMERIIFCMDSFAMRVLLDRLIGRFADLCLHRNASHALEALFAVSVSGLDQEAQLENSSKSNNKSNIPQESDQEGLPSMSALLSQACEDMLSNLESISCSPSACHVLLTVFLLCFGKPVDQESYRSKKSKIWRSKQAKFHSASNQKSQASQSAAQEGGHGHDENQASADTNLQRRVPKELKRQGDRLYSQLRKNWCDSNGRLVRSTINNPATVVLLQLLIELEFDKGEAEVPGSVTDIILDGLFQTTKSTENRSDFVEGSLRDVIASRVVEGILTRLSPASFGRFHDVYLVGRLGHLCGHPVANFIIAKAVSRLDRKAFLPALEEFKPKMVDCIDNYRTGFFKSLVERSAFFGEKVQEEVIQTIFKAFGIESESEYRWIFPCLISLMRLDYLRKTTLYNQLIKSSKIPQDELQLPESIIQGSLLLQAILTEMPSSVNKIMCQAISDLPLEVVIGFSRDSIGSRTLDSLLHSTSINNLTRYKFILRFIGKFHELADDRIGSYIAEACWAVSDVYLKEKIADSIVSSDNGHQLFLQKSSYGNFFLKKMELPLFERQRSSWKDKMAAKFDPSKFIIPHPSKLLHQEPPEQCSTEDSSCKITQSASTDPSSPSSTNSDTTKLHSTKNESSKKNKHVKDDQENNIEKNDASLQKKRKKKSDVPSHLNSAIDNIFDQISNSKLRLKKKKKDTQTN